MSQLEFYFTIFTWDEFRYLQKRRKIKNDFIKILKVVKKHKKK